MTPSTDAPADAEVNSERANGKTQMSGEVFVDRLFQLLLKRRASSADISFLMEGMRSGRTRAEIVRECVTSDEFSQRIRRSPTEFAGVRWQHPAVLHAIVAGVATAKDPLGEDFRPEPYLQSRKGAKWLVLSHCQTLGLANCLAQQNPGVEMSACDIWAFTRDTEYWKTRIDECDHLFVNSDLLAQKEFDFSTVDHVTAVPALWFGGYHPDTCYVSHDGAQVKTCMDNLNSIVAFACFKKGLSVSEAVKRFNGRTYEAGQYYRIWNAEREVVLSRWREIGYDMTSSFRRWAMRGAFMHTINHPQIACLYDVARIATQRAGFEPVLGDEQFHPHDNLKLGPIFPVYPEVGDAHGVPDSYWFKGDSYGLISLEDFIASSYASYRNFDRDGLTVDSYFSHRYKLVFDAI